MFDESTKCQVAKQGSRASKDLCKTVRDLVKGGHQGILQESWSPLLRLQQLPAWALAKLLSPQQQPQSLAVWAGHGACQKMSPSRVYFEETDAARTPDRRPLAVWHLQAKVVQALSDLEGSSHASTSQCMPDA